MSDRYYGPEISDEEVQQQYREEQLAKLERWKAENKERKQKAKFIVNGQTKISETYNMYPKDVTLATATPQSIKEERFLKRYQAVFSKWFYNLNYGKTDCSYIRKEIDVLLEEEIADEIYYREVAKLAEKRRKEQEEKKKREEEERIAREQRKLKNRILNALAGCSWYKEMCYKRIHKIHGYYESGSISQEEFESLKGEILSKIKR